MVLYPHTRIFVGPSRTVDIAGPHIQVLDTTTGDILHSTANFPEERLEAVLKSGPVRCAAVDREYRFLITSGEDKMLKLWNLEGLEIVNERELPKKPTGVAFTADAQTILVSDKFGDVFSYPFVYTPSSSKDTEKQNSRDALASHENPSNGQLILGHASPLNAFLLTLDEKYIVTADRDEHVRVSWFPKGYNIEMYCLGHLKFVSAIHIPPSAPSSLVSGGGDPMLKIWDWMTGAVKHELPVLDAVEPFIAVRALKRKRGSEDDDDEAAPQGKPKPKRKRGRKGGKGKEVEVEQGEGEEGGSATPTGADAEGVEQQKEKEREDEKPEKVLVIHRIESVESEAGPYIVFSAVGATSLFAFPYTTDVSASDIRHFDFGVPVLDFSVVDGRTVVANLDSEWTPEGLSEISAIEKDNGAGATSMVKVLTISEGQLIEDSNTLKFLIDSLNSRSLLPSTPESLKKLALYADLVSLPKYVDPTDGDEGADQDGSTLPIGAPELSSSEAAKAKGKSKAELSKKELGRIKTKEAVRAFAMEIEAGGDKDKVRKVPEDGDDEEAPEAKRVKADVGLVSAGGGDGEDVNMADS